jgi:sigma-B regulation protein RsbU (phosphoserine phosphatase)
MDVTGILIVDDNEINRDICALNLEHMGVPLYFAENGIEGLNLAREKQPDLILLDIMMPEMDGFEMLTRLKKDEGLSHIPVLMLTAKSEVASVVKALEMGANDYLKKPFSEEEMVARVKTLLRNRYLEKKIAEDLAAGAIMQQKFLTDFLTTESLCNNAGIAVNIFNRPYSTISGDFFYSFTQADGKLGFFIGDSCGHGLPAALISMRVIGFLQQLANNCHSAAEILNLLNDDICGLLPLGRFVAASVLIFNDEEVTMSNGGQPYPVLISDCGIVEIEHDSMPLGLNCRSSYSQTTFQFKRGNKLLIYTDGIVETIDISEQVYGKKRLYGCLKMHKVSAPGHIFRQAILDDITTFCGSATPDDDQTLIVFEKY